MDLKLKIDQENTSESLNLIYYSEPNLKPTPPATRPTDSKIRTKYQHEYDQFKEETRLRINQRLLKLDFIIRNTKDLNRILDPNSPEDGENMQD